MPRITATHATTSTFRVLFCRLKILYFSNHRLWVRDNQLSCHKCTRQWSLVLILLTWTSVAAYNRTPWANLPLTFDDKARKKLTGAGKINFCNRNLWNNSITHKDILRRALYKCAEVSGAVQPHKQLRGNNGPDYLKAFTNEIQFSTKLLPDILLPCSQFLQPSHLAERFYAPIFQTFDHAWLPCALHFCEFNESISIWTHKYNLPILAFE